MAQLTMLLRVFLGLVFVCLATGPAAAELPPLFAELQQAAAQTETLSSEFVQEKHLEMFSETLKSRGRFTYKRPDRLRWELLEPLASGFVLRGEKGERWNRLSGERSGFSVSGDPIMGVIAQQLLAWARVDLDWLQQRYLIAVEQEQPLQLRLVPLDQGEAGFIDHLLIRFDAGRRYVAEVLMVEPGGDSTRLSFREVRINQPLAADSFQAPEL